MLPRLPRRGILKSPLRTPAWELAMQPTLGRRQLFQFGGIGVLGLGLPELLRASPGASLATRGGPRSCIFIVQYGGCSHIDSFAVNICSGGTSESPNGTRNSR